MCSSRKNVSSQYYLRTEPRPKRSQSPGVEYCDRVLGTQLRNRPSLTWVVLMAESNSCEFFPKYCAQSGYYPLGLFNIFTSRNYVKFWRNSGLDPSLTKQWNIPVRVKIHGDQARNVEVENSNASRSSRVVLR